MLRLRPSASLRRWVSSRAFDPSRLVSKTTGTPGTLAYRLFVLDPQLNELSPWHDVPLLAAAPGAIHYVNEIPHGTTAKLECNLLEQHNPLAQDESDGAPRHYGLPTTFNYGFAPQTWEDPTDVHPDIGLLGDADPVDVVEISGEPLPAGACVAVKPLGALALIDQGEIDWKILALRADHPLASGITCAESLEEAIPGKVDAVREWFRTYKTLEGKPPNDYGFAGLLRDAEYARQVLDEAHEVWKGDNLKKWLADEGAAKRP